MFVWFFVFFVHFFCVCVYVCLGVYCFVFLSIFSILLLSGFCSSGSLVVNDSGSSVGVIIHELAFIQFIDGVCKAVKAVSKVRGIK